MRFSGYRSQLAIFCLEKCHVLPLIGINSTKESPWRLFILLMPRFIRLANYAKCAAPDQAGCQQANEDGRCTFRHQCPAACAKPQLQTPLPVDNFVTFVDCIDADSKKLSLAALHRRTIAVQVALAGEERVLLGQGR